MPSRFFQQIAGGFVVIAIAALAAARPIAAQEADGDFEGEKQYTAKDGTVRELKEPNSKERKKFTDLFVQGKTNSKEEEQVFEDAAHYYVYALTWKENTTQLDHKRKDLKNKYLVQAGQKNRAVTDLHKRLNELTLTTCRAVAEDAKYPRVVRYGCALMIGELDSQEVQPGVSPPVPLAEATSTLIEMASDPKQHLAIRICAVIGLKRHTQFGIAAALQPQMAEKMVAVLEEPIGEGKDRIGQVWLRMDTADLVQLMAAKQIPVDQPKVATALMGLIADDTIPAWARSKLAGDLGKLDGKALQAAKPAPAVRSLAALMLAASQASPFLPAEPADDEAEGSEDDAKKDEKKKDDGKKDGEKDEKDAKKEEKKDEISPAAQKVISEELLWELSQIRLALYGKEAVVGKDSDPSTLNGLFVAADDTTKPTIIKIVKHIDQIVKSLADPKTLGSPKAMEKLGDMLVTANEDLEDVLSAPAVEEAQANAPPGAARPRPQGNAPAEESRTSE